MGSEELVEIAISNGAERDGESSRTSVDITSRPFGLMELVGRFDEAAESQAIALSPASALKLGRLLRVDPIRFLEDGRWRLSLIATRAELELFS